MIRLDWTEIQAAAEAALASEGATPTLAERKVIRAVARAVAGVLGSSVESPGDAPAAAWSSVGVVSSAGGSASFEADPGMTSDVTWTLPPSDGTAGQALTTDGAGTLSWGAGGGGGGSVAVKDEGSTVVASASAVNFAGAGVTATDAGGGVALVTIPGGAAVVHTHAASDITSGTLDDARLSANVAMQGAPANFEEMSLNGFDLLDVGTAYANEFVGSGAALTGLTVMIPLVGVTTIVDSATHVLWEEEIDSSKFPTGRDLTLKTRASVSRAGLTLTFSLLNVTDATTAATTSHTATSPDTQSAAVTLASGTKLYRLTATVSSWSAAPDAADGYSVLVTVE